MRENESDDLFGEGLHTGPDFIVKAQLKVPVRPMPSAVAQDLYDDVLSLYGDCLTSMENALEAILVQADTRKSTDALIAQVDNMGQLFLMEEGDDLHKAGPAGPKQPKPSGPGAPVKAPATTQSGQLRQARGQGPNPNYQRKEMDQARAGSRGGRFYVTESGKVRYGVKPMPHLNEREATAEEVQEHFKHLRPHAFTNLDDKELRDLIRKHGTEKFGMEQEDVDFFEWWDDAGLAVFRKSLGIKDADLSGDLSQRKYTINGLKGLSYEEAVHEFLLANAEKFLDVQAVEELGHNPRELLDGILHETYERYDKALSHPALRAIIAKRAEEIEIDQRGYFIRLEKTQDLYDGLSAQITGGADTETTAFNVTLALKAMGMALVAEKGKVSSGDLKGVIAPNTAALDEKKGWLIKNTNELDRFSSSQLMSTYIAAHLNDMFIGKNYVLPEAGTELVNGALHDELMDRLASRLKLNDTEKQFLMKRLDEVAIHTAAAFNKGNSGEDRTIREVFKLSDEQLQDGKALEEARERAEHWNNLRTNALKAQEDSSFTLPTSMHQGKLGGTVDPKKAQPHQLINGKPMDLFIHQKQSINWMAAVKRGVLALDAGMGKTPTVITFMEKMKQEGKCKKAILFLPPSLMMQWPQEIQEYAPGVDPSKILNLAGMSLADRKDILKSQRAKDAEYIIISTGTLTDPGKSMGKLKPMDGASVPGAEGEADELEDDGTGGTDNELVDALKALDGAVFIDEAHQGGYKNANNTRHKIAKAVMEDREYAFGMTATPVPNAPIDLFHLTNLFAPGSVGDQSEWEGALHGVAFEEETQSWVVAHPENIVELNKRVKPFVFHKLIDDPEVKADMGKVLPPIRSNPITVKPSEVPCPETGLSQFDWLRPGGAIDVIVQKKIAQIQEKREKEGKEPISNTQMLEGALRVNLQRQAAISPALIDKRYKGPSPKLDRIVSDLLAHFSGAGGKEEFNAKDIDGKAIKQKGRPVVCFSSYPGKAFPLIKKRLIAAGIDPSLIAEIHGGKNAAERAFTQDAINAGRQKILLVGTMSGGAGLNLQKASNRMVFIDDPWSPAAKRQALGRVYRTGSTSVDGGVDADHYRVAGSADMNMEERLAGKQTLSTALLGKPDVHAFKDKTKEAIGVLSGRTVGAGLRDQQMDALIASAGELELSDVFGDEWEQANMVEEDLTEDNGKRARKKLQMPEEEMSPQEKRQHEEGKKRLRTGFTDKYEVAADSQASDVQAAARAKMKQFHAESDKLHRKHGIYELSPSAKLPAEFEKEHTALEQKYDVNNLAKQAHDIHSSVHERHVKAPGLTEYFDVAAAQSSWSERLQRQNAMQKMGAAKELMKLYKDDPEKRDRYNEKLKDFERLVVNYPDLFPKEAVELAKQRKLALKTGDAQEKFRANVVPGSIDKFSRVPEDRKAAAKLDERLNGKQPATIGARRPEPAARLDKFENVPKKPGSKPVTAGGAKGFADAVHEAMAQIPEGKKTHGKETFGDRKVFIHAIYNKLKKTNPEFKNMSLDEFKQKVVEANRSGTLAASRADLVQAMDPASVKASQIEHTAGHFHFITRPDQVGGDKPASKKEAPKAAAKGKEKPAKAEAKKDAEGKKPVEIPKMPRAKTKLVINLDKIAGPALKHKAGLSFKHLKSPFEGKKGSVRGLPGIQHDTAHHLIQELHKNKDSSLQAYADRVIKPLVPGGYTKQAGLQFAKMFVDHLRKQGVVE